MKFLYLPISLSLLFAAPLAQARQNPTPPPSGIVVHLFGPDSVMNDVLPGRQPEGASASSGSASSGSSGSQNSGYVEPSMNDILHQMFVTGDPNRPTTPSSGRAAEHP